MPPLYRLVKCDRPFLAGSRCSWVPRVFFQLLLQHVVSVAVRIVVFMVKHGYCMYCSDSLCSLVVIVHYLQVVKAVQLHEDSTGGTWQNVQLPISIPFLGMKPRIVSDTLSAQCEAHLLSCVD